MADQETLNSESEGSVTVGNDNNYFLMYQNNLNYYLRQDNLSLRDSDDTTLDPISLHEINNNHSHNLSRQESKRTYIDFVHGDPENPLNFSTARKWFITILAVMMTILVTVGAGAYSLVMPDLVREFGVSPEVATLGISLYPLGCICLYYG